MTIRAVVGASGHYLPERVVPNAEFEESSNLRRMDRTRSESNAATSPPKASHLRPRHPRGRRAALADAGLDRDDIDAIIVATSTADLTFPSAATMVQADSA